MSFTANYSTCIANAYCRSCIIIGIWKKKFSVLKLSELSYVGNAAFCKINRKPRILFLGTATSPQLKFTPVNTLRIIPLATATFGTRSLAFHYRQLGCRFRDHLNLHFPFCINSTKISALRTTSMLHSTRYLHRILYVSASSEIIHARDMSAKINHCSLG